MNIWKVSLIVVLISFVLAACSNEPIQDTLMQQDFGTVAADFANDVAAPKGGVGAFVVGFTGGALDGPNLGANDAFIRKYDGGVIWASQFGTRADDGAINVAVTSTGISYVLGYTRGALGFKVGGYDSFLRKYTASGVLQWTRQFGTTNHDSPRDITLDSSGNVYVLSQESGSRFKIRKFNARGSLLLTISNNEANITLASALGVDSTGNIFVLTQYTEGSIRWGKIYKYSSTGTLLTGVIFSGQQIVPYDLVIDSNNNLTYSIYNSEDNSGGGGYVIRVNNALTQYLWTQRIEPASTGRVAFPRALTLDSNNHVYVTGDTTGAYPGFANAGNTDIFVLKLASATGNRLWTRQFGGNDQDDGKGIAISDALYIAGVSKSSPNLLGDTSHGFYDAFLAQLDPRTGTVLGIDQ
jgi:hypothetical protein